jgi:xanthine dehydrogenase accessory factor
MRNLYLKIPEMQSVNSDLVVATVTRTVGSTPQKPGSSALFCNEGLITGTVGGGIVEGRVKEFAVRSSQTRKSGYLHLSLDRDISDKEDAICGGEISILVDADPYGHLPVFRDIRKSINGKIPGVLITMVEQYKESEVKIDRFWMTKSDKPALPEGIAEKIQKEVADILISGNREDYRHIEFKNAGTEHSTVFLLEPLFPLPQLYIAGAGHIGKALSHLGKMLDFEVTVTDDRKEYANEDNLPDADHIFAGDIGNVMQKTEKGPDSYIVIVTRGHKDDAEALKQCFGSDAAYIGMIGSRGKVAKMRSEFIAKGWATEEQWSRIYAPIGLDIKSKTVEEIAVSIAAEIIKVKNNKTI